MQRQTSASRDVVKSKRFGEPQTEGIIKRSFNTLKRVASSALLTTSIFLACSSDPVIPQTQLFEGNQIFFRETDDFIPFQRTGSTSVRMVAANHLVLSFRQESSEDDRLRVHAWLTDLGAQKIGQIPGQLSLQYELPNGTDLNFVLDHLQSQPCIFTATPNAEVYPALDPDPNFQGTVADGFWWIDRIRLRDAWNITTGSSDIPIAVLDSGIDASSGHFEGRDITFVSNCATDDDTTYLIEYHSIGDCAGILSYRPGPHGTQVASILASPGDDGYGGVGMTWTNPIISIDIYGALGRATNISLNSAIEYAVELGARVINISQAACPHNDVGDCIGGVPVTQDDTTEFRAGILQGIQSAHDAGVLVVLAAGNTGFKDDNEWLPPDIPEQYDQYFFDTVIVVGAVDDWDNPACRQDYGAGFLAVPNDCVIQRRIISPCECPGCNVIYSGPLFLTVEGEVVELSAPGYRIALPSVEDLSILSVTSESTGTSLGGTSVSSPMVAGAAALVLGEHPEYLPWQVKNLILTSASPTSSLIPGHGCRQIGHGILNVAAALGATTDPPEPVQSVIRHDLPSSSLPNIHGSNLVFSNLTGAYYLSLEDFEIHEIPGDENCHPRPDSEVSIYEDVAVFRCTGNSCAGGLCYYRLGSSSIDYLDISGTAGIDQSQVVYPIESTDGTLIFRIYDVGTGNTQDHNLSYEYSSNTIISFNNSRVLTTFRYDVGGTSTWNLGIYNIETGEVQIIEEYRDNDGRNPRLYGDYVVFESFTDAYESSIYSYHIGTGSLNQLAEGLPFAESPNIWENFVTFVSGEVGNKQLFLLDIQSGLYAPLFSENHGGSIYSSMNGNVITFISYSSVDVNSGVCILGGYEV